MLQDCAIGDDTPMCAAVEFQRGLGSNCFITEPIVACVSVFVFVFSRLHHPQYGGFKPPPPPLPHLLAAIPHTCLRSLTLPKTFSILHKIGRTRLIFCLLHASPQKHPDTIL
uniref:Uncharacterized protein n=1 Tax=Eutreptiella gymnastica TaxID=73025 RepID=A0A7S4G2F9_9EUGL